MESNTSTGAPPAVLLILLLGKDVHADLQTKFPAPPYNGKKMQKSQISPLPFYTLITPFPLSVTLPLCMKYSNKRVDLLAMEGTESTTRERTTTGNDGKQAAVNMELMSGKPLHRFVRNEPRSLGIVILVFGCAELLMGFPLAKQNVRTSWEIYISLWQGALFLVCGSLSIYTEIHPSKKMVTVSLAMYVVTLLGIFVSVGYRISTLGEFTFYHYSHWNIDESIINRVEQLTGIESILLTSSLCVLALLIALSTIARLALKSTHTQVIFQHIPTPRSDTTSN